MWRFRTLPSIKRLFEEVPQDFTLRRQLFGRPMVLDVSRSVTQQVLAVEGERFIAERFLVKRLARGKRVLVDIGANIGYYLLMLAKTAAADARYICIEPSPENLPELEATLQANADLHVTLHRCAIGSRDFKANLTGGLNGRVREAEMVDGVSGIRVCPLDALVESEVDFIKIDVEGYEFEVVKGSEAIIQKHRPVMFVELHPRGLSQYGSSVEACLELLREYYTDVSLYLLREVWEDKGGIAGFSKRLFKHYDVRDPLRRISIEQAIDFAREHVEGWETLWCVCRPSGNHSQIV